MILGCGRSGTSIFGELFDALPGFEYRSEPLLAEIPAPAAGRRVAVKVPTAAPGTTPPPGCPVPMDQLWAAVPAPRVVFWQVRHPLDAVCSLRVGIDAGWAHHPRPPDWQDWVDRPLVERCAHHWAVINGVGFDHVADVAVVCRFEQMIRTPRSFAESAVRSVGLEPDAVTDELDAWAHRVRNTNDEQFVEAMTSRRHSRPDHDRRVDRWRDDLTPEQVEAVARIVGPTARRFGYDAGSGYSGPSSS